VERQLKERLVGAAVLMAMAVILIPEMLSGPRRAPAPQVAPTAERSEANLKRYTIDLNGDLNGDPNGDREETLPAAVPETSNIEAAPPPAEEVPPAEPPPEELPPAEDSAAPAPVPSEAITESPQQESSAAPVATPVPAPVAKTDPVPPPARSEARPQAAPVAPAPAPGSTRRWAVQLIAYDNRERAQRMAEDLRESNYAAFVMPVQAATGTLYRVRVGPFATRAEADNALRKLKTVTSDPTIVAQP
jgi:DedD protein